MKNCVIKDWVLELQLKEQSVLLLALRGCDSMGKNEDAKVITRAIRTLVLHNAHRDPGSFMTERLTPAFKISMFDQHPMHFVMHLIHAIEIIGYRHPDHQISAWYRSLYFKACEDLHVNFETCEEMTRRLAGDWYNPCEGL